MKKEKKNRIAWIDFFRGILIIGMIIYHIGYNLDSFFDMNINFYNPIFNTIQLVGVSAFILLSGIASNFSKNNLKRGIKILLAALSVTLLTYLFDPSYYVVFGILHFLAFSTIIYHFYRNFTYENLLYLLFTSIFITLWIQTVIVTNDYLFPFGLYTNSFVSSDYVPIFGFIIPFLIGNIIGKYLQTKKIKSSRLENNLISIIGRHGLIIYLLHQPLILSIMYLIF